MNWLNKFIDNLFKIQLQGRGPKCWSHEQIEKYKGEYYAPKIKAYNEIRWCMFCGERPVLKKDSQLCKECDYK